MTSSVSSLNRAARQSVDETTPASPGYLSRQGRDWRLDMLRGFCVLAMVVDHMGGVSPLYLFTGGDRFFTSAAEGFILISGFTAGLVYRRLIARDGIFAAAAKALRRAFSLYLLTVGLTLLVIPVAEFFRLPFAKALDLSRAASYVVSVLTFHRTYTLVNVMLLYTLLLAALPLALLLLERGRTKILLVASWALWLLYQVYPASATFTWPIDGGHLFAFSSWQVLFFTALALGYHRDRLPSPTPRSLGRLHLLAGLATAVVIGCYCLLKLPAERLPAQLQGLRSAWEMLPGWFSQGLFAKDRVGPGRIVASAAVFGFLFLSLTRWWSSLSRPLKPLLLPLGQNALYAWTAHIILGMGAALFLELSGLGEGHMWLNTVLQIGAVILIWLMIRQQFLAVTPRTRPYWYAVPLVLTVLTLILLQHPVFDAPLPRSNAAPAATTVVTGMPAPPGAAAEIG